MNETKKKKTYNRFIYIIVRNVKHLNGCARVISGLKYDAFTENSFFPRNSNGDFIALHRLMILYQFIVADQIYAFVFPPPLM